jgi:hypothetical protein
MLPVGTAYWVDRPGYRRVHDSHASQEIMVTMNACDHTFHIDVRANAEHRVQCCKCEGNSAPHPIHASLICYGHHRLVFDRRR